MPGYVAQQQGLTRIPQGPLTQRNVGPLIIQLRESEIRKNRAIALAIRERNELIRRYRQPAPSRGWF